LSKHSERFDKLKIKNEQLKIVVCFSLKIFYPVGWAFAHHEGETAYDHTVCRKAQMDIEGEQL